MKGKIRLRSEMVQNPAVRIALRPRRPTSPWKVSPASFLFFTVLVVAGFGYWCWDCATLEARALRGNAKAQYRMGKRSLERAKTEREHAQAVEWIRLAADQGNAKAETGLGLLYTRGLGLERDYAEANKWLHRAAEQGAAGAQNELGIIYAKGMGVPQNLDPAIFWCGKAAAQGIDERKTQSGSGPGHKAQLHRRPNHIRWQIAQECHPPKHRARWNYSEIAARARVSGGGKAQS